MYRKNLLLCVVGVFLLTGCATVPTDPLERAEYYRLNDPLEPFNRAMFEGNQRLDRYLLRPIAEAYDYVPSFVRTRIDNLLDLHGTPFEFVNYVLQGEREAAGNALARILLNTLLGLGGLFDVATAVGVPRQDTDFAITLGKWGIPEGPYLVLPVIGPTTVRGLFGRGIEAAPYVGPLAAVYEVYGITLEVALATTPTRIVHGRHGFLDASEALERDSLDYYAAVRSFYRQYRRALVGHAMEEGGYDAIPGGYGIEDDADWDALAPAPTTPMEEDFDVLAPSPRDN